MRPMDSTDRGHRGVTWICLARLGLCLGPNLRQRVPDRVHLELPQHHSNLVPPYPSLHSTFRYISHGIIIAPRFPLTPLRLQPRQAPGPLTGSNLRRIHYTATARERTAGARERENGEGETRARRAEPVDGRAKGRDQRSGKTIYSKSYEPLKTTQ